MKIPRSSTFNPLLQNLLRERKSFTSIGVYETVEDIKQINTDAGRFYEVAPGVRYPSVTTVTGLMTRDGIAAWRQKVGEEEANRVTTKAAARGTRIHQLCEDYLTGAEIDVSKYSFEDAINFRKLKLELDFHLDNIRMQETRLYSNFLKMAGTVDCVAEWDSKLAIIDFKTARKAKERSYIEHYFCQATAYAIMYEELFNIPITRLVIAVVVDDDDPQIFTSHRDRHVEKLMETRLEYHKLYNV